MKTLSYISSATFSATQAALFVMYPILAERLGLSASAVVGCFSVGSFLFLWSSPFWAAQSEGHQRLPVLRAGLYGAIAALLSLIALLSFGSALPPLLCLLLLGLSRIIYGLTTSAIVPVAQALLGSTENTRERVRSLATLSMFLNLGRLFGPLFAIPFLTLSPISLLAVPLLLFFAVLPLSGKEKLRVRARSVREFRLRDLWPKDQNQRWIALLALLTTSVVGILQSSLGIYLQESFALTSEEASALMAKLLILAVLTTVLVQFILRSTMRHPWQGSMPLGAFALAVGSLGLFLKQDWIVLYGSVVVLSAGVALLTPSYTAAMSLEAQSEGQGRSAGNLSTAHTLGYALGGLLTSIGLQFAPAAPFAIAILLSFGAIVLMGPLYGGRASEFRVEGKGKSL